MMSQQDNSAFQKELKMENSNLWFVVAIVLFVFICGCQGDEKAPSLSKTQTSSLVTATKQSNKKALHTCSGKEEEDPSAWKKKKKFLWKNVSLRVGRNSRADKSQFLRKKLLAQLSKKKRVQTPSPQREHVLLWKQRYQTFVKLRETLKKQYAHDMTMFAEKLREEKRKLFSKPLGKE